MWTYDPNNNGDRLFVRDVANELHRLRQEGSVEVLIEPPKLYTPHEVAKITGRHYETILNHLKCEPQLLKAKKSGKRFLITHEDLENYIKN